MVLSYDLRFVRYIFLFCVCFPFRAAAVSCLLTNFFLLRFCPLNFVLNRHMERDRQRKRVRKKTDQQSYTCTISSSPPSLPHLVSRDRFPTSIEFAFPPPTLFVYFFFIFSMFYFKAEKGEKTKADLDTLKQDRLFYFFSSSL